MASQRQREVEALVARLAAFRPTKVALEFPAAADERVNAKYRDYVNGAPLGSNEIYQIGFRLAKRLGHTRIYGIDAAGREYYTADEWKKEMQDLGGEALRNGPWNERYDSLHRYEDEVKTRVTLAAYLRYLNSPERVRLDHGWYLTGLFHAGRGDDHFGADNLAGWWYDRNLRIFDNITRLIESPDDRILVLIGAGHLPLLLQAADSSPEIERVDAARYLR